MWIVTESGELINLIHYDRIEADGWAVVAQKTGREEVILFSADGANNEDNEARAETVKAYLIQELVPVGLRLNRDDVLVDVKEVLIVDDPTE